MHLAILVKNASLIELAEHAVDELQGVMAINELESLVLVDSEVLARLLQLARPEDKCIDDVIRRVAR